MHTYRLFNRQLSQRACTWFTLFTLGNHMGVQQALLLWNRQCWHNRFITK